MSAADKVKLDETLPKQITELGNNVYTKEEINNKFDNVPTVENTYTKAEVDKAIADAIKALIPVAVGKTKSGDNSNQVIAPSNWRLYQVI